jgi:integrase
MFAQLGVALKHQLDLAALLEPLLCKFCRKGEDFRADLFANITGCIRMLCLAPDALWHNDIDLPTTSTRPTSDPTTTSIWIAATAGQRPMIHKLATELATKKKVKPGLNIHGLRHSLGKELYDLGLEREARKAVMAHESDAASKVYERDGDRSKQADRAVRALNRQHLKIGDEGT